MQPSFSIVVDRMPSAEEARRMVARAVGEIGALLGEAERGDIVGGDLGDDADPVAGSALSGMMTHPVAGLCSDQGPGLVSQGSR